jgi:hypothetical protein
MSVVITDTSHAFYLGLAIGAIIGALIVFVAGLIGRG